MATETLPRLVRGIRLFPELDLDSPRFTRVVAFAFIAPVVVAFVIAILSVVFLYQSMRNEARLANEASGLLVAVERVDAVSEEMIGAARGMLMTRDQVFWEEYERTERQFREALQHLMRRSNETRLDIPVPLVERLGTAARDWAQGVTDALARHGNLIELNAGLRPRRERFQASIDELRSAVVREHDGMERRVKQSEHRALWVTIGAMSAILVLLTFVTSRVGKIYVSLAHKLQTAVAQKNASVELLTRANRELRRNEETLSSMTERLKGSNEELEKFASVAAHDLSEPLRMISAHLGVLDRKLGDRLTSSESDSLRFAVDGAKRLSAMLKGLLDYARISAPSDPAETVRLEKAVSAAAANLRLALTDSGGHVSWDALPEVKGHFTQFLQLFQNLIANAIKYRSEAPPVIHVRSETRPTDYLISVRDNGVGIDMSQADRAFQLFQRLGDRTTPGLGLGLSVAKRIVERHGGKIWLESAPGQGTTVFFTLPA